MSAEDNLPSGASPPGSPTTSKHSTLTSPSEGEDDKIEPEEENSQDGSISSDNEGSSEEEESLEEEKSSEEEEYSEEDESPEEERNLREKKYLEEDDYLDEKSYLFNEKSLPKENYLDEKEFKKYLEKELKAACSSAIKSNHIARSPEASTSRGFRAAPHTYAALPHELESAIQSSTGTPYCWTPYSVSLKDQASQTEWAYQSKTATPLRSKVKRDRDVLPALRRDDFEASSITDEEKVEDDALETLTQKDFWDSIMNEPIDKQGAEDFNDSSIPSSYNVVLREIIKEMVSQEELKEDFDIPMSKLLEDENRKKLRTLLKKNLEKYKETIASLMRKREAGQKMAELVTFTYRLSTQSKPKELEAEVEESPPSSHSSQQKKKIELDTEWTRKKMKAHQGDGKLILYPSGSVFQVLFPNGTGQIHYPSGNLAMLISCTEGTKITYIVLEDSSDSKVRALINNSGHATFYDKNGGIWLSLSRRLGYYFPKGKGQKAWNWWDLSIHVHAPPLKRISLKLNQYIKIQVRSQDKIVLCFSTPKQKRIYFNLGTRYKFINFKELSAMKKMPILEKNPGPISCKIQDLLGKMSKILNFLTLPELENFTADAQLLLMDISINKLKCQIFF